MSLPVTLLLNNKCSSLVFIYTNDTNKVVGIKKYQATLIVLVKKNYDSNMRVPFVIDPLLCVFKVRKGPPKRARFEELLPLVDYL